MKDRDKMRWKQQARCLSGINRKGFDKMWKAAGGQVDQVRGTGEHRYSHQELDSSILIGRKKSVPRSLSNWLRRRLTKPGPDRRQ